MVSIDIKNINESIIHESLNMKIDNIKTNIENIREFSEVLMITSITPLDESLDKSLDESYDILYLIKIYEHYIKAGQFDNLKCPVCKSNKFHNHKSYKRNLIFCIGKYLIESEFLPTVVECDNCKEEIDTQHYHTIFPSFIFPYHIYSANIILKSFYARFIEKIRVEKILNAFKIQKQQFYNWLKGLKKYIPSLLVLFSMSDDDMRLLISRMYESKDIFPYKYFLEFFHPFFLFKKTCVPNQSLIRDFE